MTHAASSHSDIILEAVSSIFSLVLSGRCDPEHVFERAWSFSLRDRYFSFPNRHSRWITEFQYNTKAILKALEAAV